MNKKIILIGAPGSGKGTQAKFLENNYGYKHISTGDILRAEVEINSELGKIAKEYMNKGALVPDNIINEMVINSLKENINNNILLDGFPRNIKQAEFIDNNKIKFDLVIYFKITLENVLNRMAGRLTCKTCGASYNIKFNPPKKNMICDLDNQPLYIREDDKKETVEKRFNTFLEQTEPLLKFYKDRNNLFEINAENDIKEIHKEIVKKLT